MKKLAVLGCSGSIGTTTLNIVREHKNEFSVTFLANNTRIFELKKLINEFKPNFAVCFAANYFYNNGVEEKIPENFWRKTELYENVDIVINGIVGLAGFLPSIEALKCNKILATANKESLVCGGNFLNDIKRKYNGKIYPLDSEHSTVWQCLLGHEKELKSIILTASGGAFRDFDALTLKNVTANQALSHPNWIMGQKVTVDCATLMNKGMEIIEAKRLFLTENVNVLLHRESIIHALVEFADNALICGLSTPDMTIPIQYALSYPVRLKSRVKSLNLSEIGTLNFSEIDENRFPCFKIAKEVSKYGDIAGTIMSVADEVLVNYFIEGKIGFYDVSDGIQRALDKFFEYGDFRDENELFGMERSVKEYTLDIV